MPQGADEVMDPISQEEWKRFNDKAQWDIITALRGPDINSSDTIKHFTTGVIRYRMINVTATHGSVNGDLGVVVLPDHIPSYHEEGIDLGWRGRPVEKDKHKAKYPHIAFWSAEHFLQHVREAAEYLHIPIVWCPGKVWEAAMCEPVRVAGKMILTAIEDKIAEEERAHAEYQQEQNKALKQAIADGDVYTVKLIKADLGFKLRRSKSTNSDSLKELRRHVMRLVGSGEGLE